MSSVAQVLLAALEATGEVVTFACPGCKALVNLADELAKLVLAPATTEQEQIADAEQAIDDADAQAVAALAAAHVHAPSPVVQAAGAGAATVVATLAAPTPAPAVEHAQPAGTVAKW